MKIFTDILTGDEVLSDSYPMKEIDGCLLEFDCAMITVGGENIDTGANASAEGGDEDDFDDNVQKVNNIIHSFHYESVQFDAKTYKVVLRDYLKSVKEKMAEKGKPKEEIDAFMAGAKAWMPKILAGVQKNEYEFYTANLERPDGMVILLNYREDGVTPYVTIWKHGVDEIKV